MVKKSPENTTPAIVDNVEALEAKLAQMREAQALFATYTQEQVDKIFYEAAMAANKARIPLAKMAIEETGRGVLEDKVIKNHYAAEYIYNAYKNTVCSRCLVLTSRLTRAMSRPMSWVSTATPSLSLGPALRLPACR